MKNMLDTQIQLHQQEKESLKQETRELGQKVAADHAKFEEEQRIKRQEKLIKSKAHQQDVKK